MSTHRSPTHHSSTASKRGLALARKVRKRELDAARARESDAKRERVRRRKLQAKARRRSGRRRARVEVLEGLGERTLVFHGPHTDFDFWMLTGILGACLVLPLSIGLFFLHWIASLSVIGLALGGCLIYVYSPVRITVTDNGYFEAKRPFLPSRDLGTIDELDLEVYVDNSLTARFYRVCTIESKRWKLWTVRHLSPKDEATIETFKQSLTTVPPQRPHAGGYRRAA